MQFNFSLIAQCVFLSWLGLVLTCWYTFFLQGFYCRLCSRSLLISSVYTKNLTQLSVCILWSMSWQHHILFLFLLLHAIWLDCSFLFRQRSILFFLCCQHFSTNIRFFFLQQKHYKTADPIWSLHFEFWDPPSSCFNLVDTWCSTPMFSSVPSTFFLSSNHTQPRPRTPIYTLGFSAEFVEPEAWWNWMWW